MAGVFTCGHVIRIGGLRCRFMRACHFLFRHQLPLTLRESGLSCKARRLIRCRSRTKARPVLGKAIGENVPCPFLFIPQREPTSAPMGHLLPWEGGRAVSPRQSLSAWEGSAVRIPLSRTVISSESEKSFSFAVKRCMRVNGNGKPDTPRIWDTVFHANGLAQVSRKA